METSVILLSFWIAAIILILVGIRKGFVGVIIITALLSAIILLPLSIALPVKFTILYSEKLSSKVKVGDKDYVYSENFRIDDYHSPALIRDTGEPRYYVITEGKSLFGITSRYFEIK